MFRKILIANRGEIACRIIRTARAMNIQTVAVYSDADLNALHVQQADEAVYIGPAPAAESYLVMDNILEAIRKTGAEAVHPGYGFLSENKKFAEMLEKESVVFIGPPATAIESMGDKITSKKLAKQAGVSVIPGHIGLIENADEAVKIANEIGYPVMLKASAGGGGKGMRLAYNDVEAREGFQSSKNEAANSFGDDRIFIEKFITQPRHIEIQLLGDQHGNMVYLAERECSIQRRNQKVIEEAPSPFIDEKTRQIMGEQAIALAQAVHYHSAGTVEFVVDGDKNFYFLEMNTRLQVEHPVTELITGIDLVEQMINIAAGGKLTLKQKDIKISGWAIESRIYAEDPYRGFLPSTGRLTYYRPPQTDKETTGKQKDIIIRNDTGVYEGSDISIYYDPMIAKLVTHAPNRDKAIAAMADALDHFRIDGVSHNIDFLAAIMGHKRFIKGNLTTGFIDEEYPQHFAGAPVSAAQIKALAAIGFFMQYKLLTRATHISDKLAERAKQVPNMLYVQIGDKLFEASHIEGGVLIDKKPIMIESDWQPGALFFQGMVDGKPITLAVENAIQGFVLTGRGARVPLIIRTKRAQELSVFMPEKTDKTSEKVLRCPMPGVVVSVAVAEGEEVKSGQALLVVEAMKMENILRAEKDAVIAKVPVCAGDKLAVDDVLIEFA
ncbi:MAG: acetyl/propionyl/methylcrotonyl-CoA carboxylase subunit alpha [Alphaproteobacteria bacterium]|nr:acetyl/propionyl/methylcrotonyl-CoA carboxylase subunit alpha [Alphaproteobacteria bacterium]